MKHNPENECPHCGMKYSNFRCGYDFSSIVELMWVDYNKRPWPQKRRGGRLGKLREIKVEMWNIHICECFSSCSDFVLDCNSIGCY